MRLQIVERRKWISEEEFIRVLNFYHVLPGPEATQLAISIGYKKRGYFAGVLALFILPRYITLSALAALARISRAALKGPFPLVLAISAFTPSTSKIFFIPVLLGCSLIFIEW